MHHRCGSTSTTVLSLDKAHKERGGGKGDTGFCKALQMHTTCPLVRMLLKYMFIGPGVSKKVLLRYAKVAVQERV